MSLDADEEADIERKRYSDWQSGELQPRAVSLMIHDGQRGYLGRHLGHCGGGRVPPPGGGCPAVRASSVHWEPGLMRGKLYCGVGLPRGYSVSTENSEVLHFGVSFGDSVEDNGIPVLGLPVV